MSELIYVFEGDDHERETLTADSEADARTQCADAFNDRYSCDCDGRGGNHTDDCSRGTYDGTEFDLIGTYRGNIDDPDTWTRAS
ncbi:hypothetical protein [Gordonia malaquae]|uniref:hypothetical protein n=1 Tax=Gordonia malaquae TaxID=410332 RepID=UPI0030174F28